MYNYTFIGKNLFLFKIYLLQFIIGIYIFITFLVFTISCVQIIEVVNLIPKEAEERYKNIYFYINKTLFSHIKWSFNQWKDLIFITKQTVLYRETLVSLWTPSESFQRQPFLQIVYSEDFGTKSFRTSFYLGVCIAINFMSIFSVHLLALSIWHKQLVARPNLAEVSNMIDGVFTLLPILPLPMAYRVSQEGIKVMKDR